MRKLTVNPVLILSLCLCLVPGCADFTGEHPVNAESRQTGEVSVTLSPVLSSLTKSSLAPDDDAVECYDLFITNEYGQLASSYHIDGDTSVSVSLMSGKSYTVSVLANMGDRHLAFSEMSEIECYIHKLTPEVFNAGYIPMFGQTFVTVDGQSGQVEVSVERLYARYDFRFDPGRVSVGNLSVKSLSVRNIAAELPLFAVEPYFGSDGMELSVLPYGDSATEEDIMVLNGGGTLTIYVPENLQGYEEGITNPDDKVPTYKYETVNPDMCTYLEIVCTLTEADGIATPLTYRMYLGENATSSFNVRRNTAYLIVLEPNDVNLRNNWWKFEPDVTFESSWEYDIPVITVADIADIPASGGRSQEPVLSSFSQHRRLVTNCSNGRVTYSEWEAVPSPQNQDVWYSTDGKAWTTVCPKYDRPSAGTVESAREYVGDIYVKAISNMLSSEASILSVWQEANEKTLVTEGFDRTAEVRITLSPSSVDADGGLVSVSSVRKREVQSPEYSFTSGESSGGELTSFEESCVPQLSANPQEGLSLWEHSVLVSGNPSHTAGRQWNIYGSYDGVISQAAVLHQEARAVDSVYYCPVVSFDSEERRAYLSIRASENRFDGANAGLMTDVISLSLSIEATSTSDTGDQKACSISGTASMGMTMDYEERTELADISQLLDIVGYKYGSTYAPYGGHMTITATNSRTEQSIRWQIGRIDGLEPWISILLPSD